MPSASFFAASAVAPNVAFAILSLLYVLASRYVYFSLIHQLSARNILGNFLLTVFLVLFIVTFLRLRAFDVGSLGGFYRISFLRTLSTGAILLFFAYPLILWS